MKVFLIGYMGSGKSTAGKKLAEKLKLRFIDFDNYIEKESGKTIPEIFRTQGEQGFRLLEKKNLEEIIREENAVISLGGGTPCFYNNMELINSSGISVYIETPVDVLAGRLIRAKKKRPLIEGMNEAELTSHIESTLKQRQPYYLKAQHVFKAGHHNVNEVAEGIAALLKIS